jgi:predicted  nucleic acid-binding Zn-ribbon protein
VHPDLVALLALQEDDTAVAAIEDRLRELDEQLAQLDRERAALGEAVARARETADAEERKRRELALKVQEHKSLQERNLAALDAVRKAREATAALAQIDITRRVLAQEESDLQALSGRITDLRQAVALHEQALAEMEKRQEQERAAMTGRRAELEQELAQARARRAATAAKVSRPILAKYERIRGRGKNRALYRLEGAACGRCNTAIPLQRRNVMAAGRSIEVCEGCGVLLYASA